MKLTDYNWSNIQKDYDSGMSTREICKLHSIKNWTLYQAKDQGLFITRTVSEGIKVSCRRKPRKVSQETRDKISKSMRKFLAENPDKVGYVMNHYSKKTSYPEQYFLNLFEVEKIDLKHHLRVSFYELDFYNEEKKVYVEIDGEQHFRDNRIIESDRKRTEYLENLGWKGYRVRWAEYQKLDFEAKKRVVDQIKNLLEGRETFPILPKKSNYQGKKHKTPCPTLCICGKQIKNTSKRCISCAAKRRQENARNTSVEFERDQLIEHLVKCKGNIVQVAKIMNISDNGVRKKCSRLRIDYKLYRGNSSTRTRTGNNLDVNQRL